MTAFFGDPVLFLLLLACQSTEGSWNTLFEPVPVAEPVVEAADAPDPMADEFAKARELDAQAAGGWDDLSAEADADSAEGADDAGADDAGAADAEPSAAVTAAVPAPVAPMVPVAAAPPAVGLATQPSWGLRLLSTLPAANPPRAAIGLPDGRELVVSPGTLLPEVGVIVISVGTNSVQVARVTPAGDHANIEPTTLFAQYGGAASNTP